MIRFILLVLLSSVCYADSYQTFYDSKGNIDVLLLDNIIRKLDRGLDLTIEESSVTAKYILKTSAEALYLRKSSATPTTSSLQIGNLFFQWGWGDIQGDNTIAIEEAVTFGTAFTGMPYYVGMTNIGETNVAAPNSIDDFITPSGANYMVQTTSITATGFWAGMRLEVGYNFPNTIYYGYTWLAIGAKN
jgi:hypothetical protein